MAQSRASLRRRCGAARIPAPPPQRSSSPRPPAALPPCRGPRVRIAFGALARTLRRPTHRFRVRYPAGRPAACGMARRWGGGAEGTGAMPRTDAARRDWAPLAPRAACALLQVIGPPSGNPRPQAPSATAASGHAQLAVNTARGSSNTPSSVATRFPPQRSPTRSPRRPTRRSACPERRPPRSHSQPPR